MKRIVIFALLIGHLASAQTNFFPLLHCKDRTYTNATIESVTPATVTVFWGGGGARIPITNLPPELQIRYHYNPQEAQKYLDKQAAKKTERQERANREAAVLASAQNTLGQAQKIRVVKTLPFPNSVQIDTDGKLSKACIANLPPEVLTFIRDLDQAQSDAAALKEHARQVRYNAERAKAIGRAMLVDNPNYEEQNAQANVALNDARDIEERADEAAANLRGLKAKAEVSTTIIARPTGIMISFDIRQWQFQSMAITNLSDSFNP